MAAIQDRLMEIRNKRRKKAETLESYISKEAIAICKQRKKNSTQRIASLINENTTNEDSEDMSKLKTLDRCW